MKPVVPITNPTFKYSPSFATDIRKTFSKARAAARVQAQQQLLRQAAAAVFPGECAEAVR